MADLRITELDFNDIKNNLKNYLKSQEEFADYDFDGAGLNVLLDVLAYNTHYNAILAHLQANEMFIDTAIKRSSVVSIAKTLGYIPRSSTCARARVNLVVTPTVDTVSTELTLLKSVKFTSAVNGVTYTFNVEDQDEQTAAKEDGVFTFTNIDLLEGSRITNTFAVTAENVSGPFVIPNNTIDTSTLVVDVQKSSSEPSNITTFTRAINSLSSRADDQTIIDLDGDSTVYWLEENTDGNYQVIFGDNIIGKQLEYGNIVILSYIACNGSNANGAREFTLEGTIDGESSVAIEIVNPSASGSFKESIDEIRFNAPKFNATRNRAVTAQDYKALILSQFSRAKSVSVWGGEENVPPIYGKVFITLDPKDGEVITESDKDFISETILRPRSVVSIQHEFVDPDYLYVGFELDIKYNNRVTTLSPSEIETLIRGDNISGVEGYFSINLQSLDKTFIYSQFVDYIKDLLPNVIVGVLAKMRLQRRLDITPNLSTSTTVRFLTKLIPETVRSTNFTTTLNDIDYDVYIQDFSNTSTIDFTGTGTLKLIDSVTKKILIENLGSVNYDTGVVTINNLVITTYFGEASELRINAIPQELGKNISPSVIPITETSIYAVSPSPSRNSIITLDDSESDPLSNLTEGLRIHVSPYIASI
jgi:hypothetical protein